MLSTAAMEMMPLPEAMETIFYMETTVGITLTAVMEMMLCMAVPDMTRSMAIMAMMF